MTVDKCPICGETLTRDEVDIGVGTVTTGYRCSFCGWDCAADVYEYYRDNKEVEL